MLMASIRKIFRRVAVGGALCVTVIAIGVAAYVDIPITMPAYTEVKERYSTSEAYLLDRHGEVIHESRIDKKGRRLDWAGIDDISTALKNAALVSEDKRFYSHNGVDWLAAIRALAGKASGEKRGASTITMQLASIIDKELRPANGRRSFKQKLRQARAARAIERRWKKDEILEAYLNLVHFRGELQGVTAASWALFGKAAHGLDQHESAVMASLIRSPNARYEDVIRRVALIEKKMESGQDAEGMELAVKEALYMPHLATQRRSEAYHVAVLLKDELVKNKEARTTLDGELQSYAGELLREQIIALKDQNVNDGAVLVVDNASGEVLAYVGSSGELSSARFVDGVRARRQAGSILKPFIYANAIDRRIVTAATVIDDSPLEIQVGNGVYRPQNYDDGFKGPVTVRTALASSINIPAVKTLLLTGNEEVLETLKGVGLTGIKDTYDYYGPSLALGTPDVSLWEMVNAYRTLANGGVWNELYLTSEGRMNGAKRVFSKETSFIIADILSDREARSMTFGLENPLSTRFWSAVKTGTSKDMRDNWCIGFSRKYTVGVWVGNFSGLPMWNVSGISGAAPVWTAIMNRLAVPDERRISMPAGVVRQTVMTGIEPERYEFFLKGTAPIKSEAKRSPAFERIIYPIENSIIAFDPDIPVESQRIIFEAVGGTPDTKWFLNNQEVGRGAVASWSPVAGKYKLSIGDGNGKDIDSVDFEVRGDERAELQR